MSTLFSFALILFVLWFFSFFIFHIAGFLIHILLIVAVVAFLWRVIQGKNPFK
ncbi:MAG: lmo0937 family membrane protein [Candidatus Paceibacterota bacterium]